MLVSKQVQSIMWRVSAFLKKLHFSPTVFWKRVSFTWAFEKQIMIVHPALLLCKIHFTSMFKLRLLEGAVSPGMLCVWPQLCCQPTLFITELCSSLFVCSLNVIYLPPICWISFLVLALRHLAVTSCCQNASWVTHADSRVFFNPSLSWRDLPEEQAVWNLSRELCEAAIITSPKGPASSFGDMVSSAPTSAPADSAFTSRKCRTPISVSVWPRTHGTISSN